MADITDVKAHAPAMIAVLPSNRPALIHNRIVTLVWRSVLLLICIAALVINLSRSNFFANLVNFTLQSNLIVLICMSYVWWATLNNRLGLPAALKSAITVYITITCLVYNLILAGPPKLNPGINPGLDIILPWSGNWLLSDLQHMIVPLLVVIDWVLFDTHGLLRWRYALIWLSYPLGYFIFVLIRGVFVHAYPYSFVNVNTLGYGKVMINAGIYTVAFWLLGVVYVVGDYVLSWRKKKM
jgi:hypothetical protein